MSSDYKNSFAQKNMTFNTTTVFETISGDNFYKLMVFVGLSDAATYFIGTPPIAGAVVEVTAVDYADIVEGLLKTWLDDFFANGTIATCYLVVFTDLVEAAWSAVDLAVRYAANKYTAYWKTIISSAHLNSACVALDALWEAESAKEAKFTQVFFGSHDAELKNESSTTGLQYLLLTAYPTSKAWLVYHYTTTGNPALAQLGKTLATFNTVLSPQSPVGSKLALLQMDTIDPSGAAGTNLVAADTTALENQFISYFEFLGNGTSIVVLFGNTNLQGVPLGVHWIPSYIDFVCEIKAAELLSQKDKYLNSSTYQEILAILGTQIKMFVDSGRLTNYILTKKPFSVASNVTADKKFIIADAWSATYVDDAQGVTVFGTLYVTI
jgi:hypothetical protein